MSAAFLPSPITSLPRGTGNAQGGLSTLPGLGGGDTTL